MNGQPNIFVDFYMRFMWFVGSPIMLLFIIIYAFMSYAPVAELYEGLYGDDAYRIYPKWSNVIGKRLSKSISI